ncbi:hypothetical protein CHI08_16915 [Peribacillus simplex]|nr:hypothetical protein CHI08_16915 [Peribacillus simplex]
MKGIYALSVIEFTISTKTKVYLRKWRYIDENTDISPKVEIYRRKQQVYLRKWRDTSKSPKLMSREVEVAGLDVWVPFFIHNANYKL